MNHRIAIVGGGVIGETLVAAILESGQPSSQLIVVERVLDRALQLHDCYGVEVTAEVEVVAEADIALLATKPQDMPDLLREIAQYVTPSTTITSLAAGVSLETLEAALPDGIPTVRAMPNTPVLVGEGVFGISAGRSCSKAQLEAVIRLLQCGGKIQVIDESDQDALTAVSGSGPAYVFYLAEAMVAGGIRAGLDRDTSTFLTKQTLLGAARLLIDSGDTPEELRGQVTSPNGTTSAAIAVFDQHNVKDSLSAGVFAAAQCSAALSATNPLD